MNDAVLSLLEKEQSWKLERISPTSSSGDVDFRYRVKNSWLGHMIRDGNCYRCRLGRNEFYYGKTAEEAVKRALNKESNI